MLHTVYILLRSRDDDSTKLPFGEKDSRLVSYQLTKTNFIYQHFLKNLCSLNSVKIG